MRHGDRKLRDRDRVQPPPRPPWRGEPGRDPANPKFSDHCFTGAYPTHLTDQTQVEPQPRQLSLLAEAS